MQKSYPITKSQVRLAMEAADRRNAAQRELLLVYQTMLAQNDITAGNVVDITATHIVIEVPDEAPADVAAEPAEVSKPQLVE